MHVCMYTYAWTDMQTHAIKIYTYQDTILNALLLLLKSSIRIESRQHRVLVNHSYHTCRYNCFYCLALSVYENTWISMHTLKKFKSTVMWLEWKLSVSTAVCVTHRKYTIHMENYYQDTKVAGCCIRLANATNTMNWQLFCSPSMCRDCALDLIEVLVQLLLTTL